MEDNRILKPVLPALVVLSIVGAHTNRTGYMDHTRTRIVLSRIYGAACNFLTFFTLIMGIQKVITDGSPLAVKIIIVRVTHVSYYTLVVYRALTGSDTFMKLLTIFSEIDQLLKYTEIKSSKLEEKYTALLLIAGGLSFGHFILIIGWRHLLYSLYFFVAMTAGNMEIMLFFSLMQSTAERLRILAEAIDVGTRPGEDAVRGTVGVEGFDVPLVDAHKAIRKIYKTTLAINSMFRKQIIMILVANFFVCLLYVEIYIISIKNNIPMESLNVVRVCSLFLMMLFVTMILCHAGERLLINRGLLREALHRRGPGSQASFNDDIRLASDLLRLVDCIPAHFTLYGLVTLRLKLLPNFLALFVSYVIIIIQFDTV